MGDDIYHKTENATDVYFIITGRVATSFYDEDNEVKTLVLIEGSYFGLSDIVFKRPRQFGAVAGVKSEIWKIQRDDFIPLLDEFD